MKTNFLEMVLNHKKREVQVLKARQPEVHLKRVLRDAPQVRSLSAAIGKRPHISVIAEIKKASPSAGIIRDNFDPLQIAKSYSGAKADALSVLTDEKFFQGSIHFISQIRPMVNVPILRKDFIIDPYQIWEARAFGTDAVLLIVAALGAHGLKELLYFTREAGMEALVEVHNEKEMEVALEQGAELIGINNRDLTTFKVDLSITERLAKIPPSDITVVGESGISGVNDLQRMVRAGINGILVGACFMKQPDPGEGLKLLKQQLSELQRVD